MREPSSTWSKREAVPAGSLDSAAEYTHVLRTLQGCCACAAQPRAFSMPSAEAASRVTGSGAPKRRVRASSAKRNGPRLLRCCARHHSTVLNLLGARLLLAKGAPSQKSGTDVRLTSLALSALSLAAEAMKTAYQVSAC